MEGMEETGSTVQMFVVVRDHRSLSHVREQNRKSWISNVDMDIEYYHVCYDLSAGSV